MRNFSPTAIVFLYYFIRLHKYKTNVAKRHKALGTRLRKCQSLSEILDYLVLQMNVFFVMKSLEIGSGSNILTI